MARIDFYSDMDLRYRDMYFSEQTIEAINRFLLDGLMPGGHLEAMFAYDYERALYNADTHNRTCFWALAMWIREFAPDESQGSYAAVKAYCNDKSAQEQFRQECEKKSVWKTLNKSEQILNEPPF
jgi:hypothetical protein